MSKHWLSCGCRTADHPRGQHPDSPTPICPDPEHPDGAYCVNTAGLHPGRSTYSPTPSEPQTEAGRDLINEVRRDPMRMRDYLSAIIAIEAEAAEPAALDADKLRRAWNEALDGHPERLRDPWPHVLARLQSPDPSPEPMGALNELLDSFRDAPR